MDGSSLQNPVFATYVIAATLGTVKAGASGWGGAPLFLLENSLEVFPIDARS